jgi:hypothetical protein
MGTPCPKCSHNNGPSARFCGECGQPFMNAAVGHPGANAPRSITPGGAGNQLPTELGSDGAQSIVPGGKGNYDRTALESTGPIVGGAAATIQEGSMAGEMRAPVQAYSPKTQLEEDVSQPIAGWLVVLRSRHMNPYHDVPIFEGRNILGRDPNRGRQHLTDTNASSEHVLILARGGVVRLTDLGSSNGTIVNNQQVDAVELNKGDMVRIGKTTFAFVPMPEAA